MASVYLLSPYHTGSHKAWAEGYVKYSSHEIHLLSMAGRFWKWRMQGGALELAKQVELTGQELGPPDILIATDMVNLPDLLALTKPRLDDVPILLYCHENQLTYPPPPGEKRDLTYGMINTMSMLVADRVAFNSEYHQAEYFEELPRLLKHFPDYNHLEIISELERKSQVLPVGLDLARLDRYRPSNRTKNGPLRILWNQRWEYDKNPGDFFAALNALDDAGLPFQLIVAGENFRNQPGEFAEAQARLQDRIIHFGFAADAGIFARLLWDADLVISTAHHEFFGVSVLEAIYCGCYPLLPARLSYPELLPESHHQAHLYHDLDDLVARLRWAAENPEMIRRTDLSQIAAAYDWRALAPCYDRTILEMVETE